ncbi:hypothetical protein M422DRAFT_255211 [Sphaerobolus stellatus SS14]|uniref:Uncharacterized protein n=1 Tax=Sphaerobolus stellatus (strain SS14) TaxID=990650 RepID=A0A0C9UFV5_SPHS4|nr:hypothetical protein M422DRAFT_255211 [Sphaerobolus stellatus SS14]
MSATRRRSTSLNVNASYATPSTALQLPFIRSLHKLKLMEYLASIVDRGFSSASRPIAHIRVPTVNAPTRPLTTAFSSHASTSSFLALRYVRLHFDASTSTWNNPALSPRSIHELMQYPSSLPGCHCRCLLDQHPATLRARLVIRHCPQLSHFYSPIVRSPIRVRLRPQAHKITRSPPLINITDPHSSAAAYVPELALAHSNSYPHLASTSNSSIGMTMGGVVGMGGEEVGGDVYIEGPPMNIDVPTLPMLVAPHVIRGNRFFADTRLQPLQLVAHIQLDSRAATQDVRNKLHGRSVRGYRPTLLSTPPVAPQAKLKLKLKDCRMYQDIYAAPQATQQQDTNNTIGSSGNVHNATGARRDHPNTNVNANGNGVGGGGYQSQSQTPEGVAVGGVGGLGRMSMGGGYGISVEPFWHTLQGFGVGARYTTRPTPGTGSATVPSPLQSISATLNPLQMQLFTIGCFSKRFEVLSVEMGDRINGLQDRAISYFLLHADAAGVSPQFMAYSGNEDLRRATKIWSSVKELYFRSAFDLDLNMSASINNPFHDIFSFFTCFFDLEVLRIISTNRHNINPLNSRTALAHNLNATRRPRGSKLRAITFSDSSVAHWNFRDSVWEFEINTTSTPNASLSPDDASAATEIIVFGKGHTHYWEPWPDTSENLRRRKKK